MLAFTAPREGGDGFDAYHRLYSVGADVERTDGPFHARVHIRRFQRMVLYERDLGGLLHRRDPRRVGRDGFDHLVLHLLLDGDLAAGPPGAEHRLRPGEIMLVNTAQPHWTRVGRARLLSVALAREIVEPAVGALDALHGAVLPGAAAGLLRDFLLSLVRRADNLPDVAVEGAADTATELLGLGLKAATAAPVARRVSAAAARPLRRTRAEAYVDTHLLDPRLDAATVAAGIGTSRSRLYEDFADEGGVARYVQRRRLERLRDALRRPGETRSASTLAFACGFIDESHSNRAFRAAFGVPPGRYRSIVHRARLDRSDHGPIESVFERWISELY
ncbi:helix-turn-helix domain-containing protein [Methylobacterium sp. J-026]|uniref:helix-turn-helix domain-containing protein n=1 Tax=Methylobacterium sp. J-026 TaxID=2836624 RepID=UPI001FB8DC2B|nr:helix-turn-helix domain-containing protein [Methylobacterium sp. J-026]MCJ2137276.1 helix-turn-helix domain-containing protein [Methylobacterium sp. J-026]